MLAFLAPTRRWSQYPPCAHPCSPGAQRDALTSSLQVRATDADSGSLGAVSYSLGSGISSLAPSAFHLGEETGQLCTTGELDRDGGIAAYDFTIAAVDGVSRASQWAGLLEVVLTGSRVPAGRGEAGGRQGGLACAQGAPWACPAPG